jgi:hypothetical protein
MTGLRPVFQMSKALPMLLLACSCGPHPLNETADLATPTAYYAAIAVVPQQGRRYWGFAARPEAMSARHAALSQCGHQRCIVASEFVPGQCAIVVQGQNQVFWGGEPPDDNNTVLDYCELQDSGCEIVVLQCLSRR